MSRYEVQRCNRSGGVLCLLRIGAHQFGTIENVPLHRRPSMWLGRSRIAVLVGMGAFCDMWALDLP